MSQGKHVKQAAHENVACNDLLKPYITEEIFLIRSPQPADSSVVQGWAKCGPRAKSGPLRHFVRPAEYLFQY